MYRDIYWSCNGLSLWTNIEEVARRFNVHEILACWARATVEVFLLIYFKVFESFRWFEDFVIWCSSFATRCFAFYIFSFNFFIIATTVELRGYKLFIVDLICGIYSDRLDRFVWQKMTKKTYILLIKQGGGGRLALLPTYPAQPTFLLQLWYPLSTVMVPHRFALSGILYERTWNCCEKRNN